MGKRDIDLIVDQALGIAEKLSKLSRARSATHKTSDLTEAEVVLLNVLAKGAGRSVSIREVLRERASPQPPQQGDQRAGVAEAPHPKSAG